MCETREKLKMIEDDLIKRGKVAHTKSGLHLRTSLRFYIKYYYGLYTARRDKDLQKRQFLTWKTDDIFRIVSQITV